MQLRHSWLTRGGGAALIIAGAWVGCTAGGTGSNFKGGEDDDGSGTGGQAGATVELPCGIDCAGIMTDECSEAVCDMATLQCAIVPLTGMECDDGLFCTIGDSCQDGVCTGAGDNDCQLDPPSWSCQAVQCNEETKSCSQIPVVEGTECIASDPCIVGASCDANNLCTGPTNDCFFASTPDSCHVALCNSTSGECEAVPGNNNLPCLDNLCSQGGSCSNGTCVGAVAKDCDFVSNACNAGSCDDTTGGCIQTAINETGACEDQDGCTAGDSCTAGACIPGNAVADCTSNDGCCGPGCTSMTDNDCQSILLFGDDMPISGWELYREALIAAGRQWDENDYDSTNMFPDATVLANYDTLIIAAESQSDWPDGDNMSVVTWLQEPGERNLLVIGKDLLVDWYGAGAGNGEFELFNLWGISFLGSSASTQIQTVDGIQLDPITDPFFSDPIRLSMDTNSSGDYANEAMGPAEHIGFYTGTGGGNGHSAIAKYAPSYQVVWVGFNMHDGIVEKAQRNELMRNILEWFKL